MGDFFQGWRRKAALMMLMMALAVTGAWVRSEIVKDTIIVLNKPAIYNLDSSRGCIRWDCYDDTTNSFPAYSFPAKTTMRWNTSEYYRGWRSGIDSRTGIDWGFDSWEGAASNWKLELFEMKLSAGKIGCHTAPDFSQRVVAPSQRIIVNFVSCVTPYWSIILPLTLLSVYLLIVKPRKPRQTKPIAPTQREPSSHA